MNLIPIMDDPLGKYWNQPADIRSVEMDYDHVILSERQVEGLSKYDTTYPSGVYPGKAWLRREVNPARHLLVWYGPETPDGLCPILFREVLVL